MELQIVIVALVGVVLVVWVVGRLVRLFGSPRANHCIGCDDETCPYRQSPSQSPKPESKGGKLATKASDATRDNSSHNPPCRNERV